jgi:hypothetical protein
MFFTRSIRRLSGYFLSSRIHDVVVALISLSPGGRCCDVVLNQHTGSSSGRRVADARSTAGVRWRRSPDSSPRARLIVLVECPMMGARVRGSSLHCVPLVLPRSSPWLQHRRLSTGSKPLVCWTSNVASFAIAAPVVNASKVLSSVAFGFFDHCTHKGSAPQTRDAMRCGCMPRSTVGGSNVSEGR